jgi:hypothetical protein
MERGIVRSPMQREMERYQGIDRGCCGCVRIRGGRFSLASRAMALIGERHRALVDRGAQPLAVFTSAIRSSP